MAVKSSLSAVSKARLEATTEQLPAGATYVIGVAIFRPSKNNGTAGWRLLVVKRSPTETSFPNMWEIPGGHVEPGETVKDAVVRETKEETSLTVEEVIGEFDEMHWLSSSGTKKNVQMNFTAIVAEDGGEVRTTPEEHSEYAWVGEEEAAGLEATEAMHKVFRDAFSFAKQNLGEPLEEAAA
jgi:mutator protein MutT